MFIVLSCVIYTIISNYICIDYLGSEIFLSDLRLGVAGSYNHLGKKYDNVLGFVIPDLLLIFFLVRASGRKMNPLSYSNVLIGCLNTN